MQAKPSIYNMATRGTGSPSQFWERAPDGSNPTLTSHPASGENGRGGESIDMKKEKTISDMKNDEKAKNHGQRPRHGRPGDPGFACSFCGSPEHRSCDCGHRFAKMLEKAVRGIMRISGEDVAVKEVQQVMQREKTRHAASRQHKMPPQAQVLNVEQQHAAARARMAHQREGSSGPWTRPRSASQPPGDSVEEKKRKANDRRKRRRKAKREKRAEEREKRDEEQRQVAQQHEKMQQAQAEV